MVSLRGGFKKLAGMGHGIKEKAGEMRENAADKRFDRGVQKRLTLLRSGSEPERTASVKGLVFDARAEERWRDLIVEAFLESLPTQTPAGQLAIIDALLDLRQELPQLQDDFYKAIRSTLDSPHSAVRLRTIELWSKLSLRSEKRRRETIPDLYRMLKDNETDVRYASEKALSMIQRKEIKIAFPHLKKTLHNNDWRVHYHGIILLLELAQKRPAIAVKLAPEAVKALASRDKIKERAADTVGLIGAYDPHAVAEAVADLTLGLTHTSSELRKAAARALGRIGEADASVVAGAVSELARGLSNDDWWIHQEVAWALGKIGGQQPGLVDPFLEVLRNRVKTGAEPPIVEACEWALENIGAA